MPKGDDEPASARKERLELADQRLRVLGSHRRYAFAEAQIGW
jgi:hypothetical protein